ncbi:hypothetical protein LLH00_09515 [bacterium]|nr:hypothetical protein [bacterium]
MIRKGILLVTLAALVGLLASPASAERLAQRISRGNNVGMGLMTGWAMPWITATWSGNTLQFPKGSGNLIGNDCWTFGIATARDFNGDGLAEDTLVLGSGGRDNMAGYCSPFPWAEQLINAEGAVEPNMEGHMAELEFNRIWTSLDAQELADWPREGREGFAADGAPILHGAETMFTHSGDVFNSWGGPTNGFYMAWSMYFLDFAESNNMVYVHVLTSNVTMYEKYNPTYGGASAAKPDPRCVANPDGWDWKGMVLFENRRGWDYGWTGNGAAWAYHPEKEIVTFWSRQPTISNFTPNTPALMGGKMLKKPMLRGQVAEMTNLWNTTDDRYPEFGFSGAGNLLASGLPLSVQYQCGRGTYPFFKGMISPLTGREVMGWPGVLYPSDSRYHQWVWGGRGNWQTYTFWSELTDVAPRDTFSFDYVIMFSPSGVTPLVAPTYDIANIDAPMMQEAFAPQAHYADVAQGVFDGGFVTPATPVPPLMTIVPGDREVTITWSDVNLQTPDPYALFLEQNPELDPEHLYRKFDFEGYRLYRSFVGPNDSHSEMIYKCSLTDGNLTFFYVDKLESDQPYFRMRNGMKVWYALVPYDRNYDPATGAAFSLPDPTSGKAWNRAGESGLYNVIPRSDASDFRVASMGNVAFSPATAANYLEGPTVNLTGDGNGKLTEAPKVIMPSIKEVKFLPVNNERITSDMTVNLVCTDQGVWSVSCGGNRMQGTRTMQIVEGAKSGIGQDLIGGSDNEQTLTYQGPADAEGINYAFDVTFQGMQQSGQYQSYYYDMDPGTYTGGEIDLPTARSCGSDSKPGTSPSNVAMAKAGRFTITWKDAGGGKMTVEVKDIVRGITIPHVDYPDQYGWGFQTKEGFGADIGSAGNRGVYYDEAFSNQVPVSQRTVKMPETISADNTEHFGLWLNGGLWRISSGGGDGITMPTAGTVWTATNAFGSWNGDGTVFTQVPDLPWLGDKWTIEIKKSTLDAKDADLSKIKVVPNPYIASSFLDLSATQRRVDFVNLPDRCTIRIYTLGGNLVNVLNHIGSNRSGWGNYTDWDRLTLSEPKVMTGYDNHSGTEPWNLRNRFGQTIASGLYFYHVTDTRGKTYTGKFYVID